MKETSSLLIAHAPRFLLYSHRTQDKLLDTLHWLKQILGVVFGLIFGLVPVTGLVGAVIFGGVNVLVTYTFYHSYLE